MAQSGAVQGRELGKRALAVINPADVCLFIGPVNKNKRKLFLRIADGIQKLGGTVIDGDFEAVKALPDKIVPIIGASPELSDSVDLWKARGRNFIYWDRGYARRTMATWLPRGEEGGYYRWHLNCFQMPGIRNVNGDRWRELAQPLSPWARNPDGHIMLAAGSPTYEKFYRIEGWTEKTIATLRKYTDREIRVSDKETKEPLSERIKGAHALVSHGSNAAVEAAIMGCPVFVYPGSAAALIGKTDLSEIETPAYPEREQWARSLAYSQFNERELVDGTLWRLMV